jgi:hypothetical protein
MREDLGIDEYEGSERTAAVTGLRRVAGRMMERALPLVTRLFRERPPQASS